MTVKSFKILGFFLIAALLTTAAAATVSADDSKSLKIVTVETNQIMEKHPAFIEAQQKLQSEIQQMQKEMEGKSEQEQQAAQQQMQQQMQQRSQQMQGEVLEKVRNNIQEIADEKGYDYVMDANALLTGGEDVTEEIVEAIVEKNE
ncbi:MAG: OmpH family outer membrane protein [Desulfobacterales bacterium]